MLKGMIDVNKEERKQIEEHAWEDITVIKEKNKSELNGIISAGMDSKTKLTAVQGRLKEAEAAKQTLERDIEARDNRLRVLIGMRKDLSASIEQQQEELKERDKSIKEK